MGDELNFITDVKGLNGKRQSEFKKLKVLHPYVWLPDERK